MSTRRNDIDLQDAFQVRLMAKVRPEPITREVVRRRGQEQICEMRGPAVKQQEARARLARMMRRGELAEAFNARIENGQYVVEYIRLRDPAPRGPRIGAIVGGVLAGLAGLGWLIWESRYVIAAALGIALGAACLYVIVMSVLHVVGRCPGHHCPGCAG